MKTFWLTQKILNAYRNNGFISAEIFGPQGVGKTTYALKVGRQVFKELGIKDSWGFALNHLFFDVRGALELLVEAYYTDQRIPILIFDDAGIWLEKYSWQREELRQFARLYKLIRSLCTAVIFTTPSEADIMKNIREKTWYKIKISRSGSAHGYRKSKANIYVFTVKVLQKRFKEVVEERAQDVFSVHLPDSVYEKYMIKRKEEGIVPQIKALLDAFPEVKERLKAKGINVEDIEHKVSISPHNNVSH